MQRLIVLFLLIYTAIVLPSHTEAQNTEKKVRYNYLTFLPENYDSLQTEAFPVIFYLHGSSASGNNLNKVKKYGLPYFMDKGKKLDFIVIAPQCPSGKNWASENWFDSIYSEITVQYRIDTTRIYLTGMSLGGFGTWALASKYPHKFAAIAPMCGGGKTEWAASLISTPVWVFHGVKDTQVPVSRSDKMVEALEKQESLVVYSRLPDKGHDLSRLFDDNSLYEWFQNFSLRPLTDEEIEKEKESLPVMSGIKVAELPVDKVDDTAKKKVNTIIQNSLF